MKKLTLTNIAHIAEVIAAVVIVISIIYVGKELKQNTQAMHDSSWQATLDKLVDLDVTEATSLELSQIIIRGETRPESMTDEEWFRFSRFAQARIGILEYGYLSNRTDALGDYHWESIVGYLQQLICLPGYQLFWSQHGEIIYHPDFVYYVDGLIANCENETISEQ